MPRVIDQLIGIDYDDLRDTALDSDENRFQNGISLICLHAANDSLTLRQHSKLPKVDTATGHPDNLLQAPLRQRWLARCPQITRVMVVRDFLRAWVFVPS